MTCRDTIWVKYSFACYDDDMFVTGVVGIEMQCDSWMLLDMLNLISARLAEDQNGFILPQEPDRRQVDAAVPAPPPGNASSPAAFNLDSTSFMEFFVTREIKNISAGVNALIVTFGNSVLMARIIFS